MGAACTGLSAPFGPARRKATPFVTRHSPLKTVMKSLLSFVLPFLIVGALHAQQSYTLTSPDGRTTVSVSADSTLTWAVQRDGVEVIAPSAIALSGRDMKSGKTFTFGLRPKVRSAQVTRVDASFATPVYKRAEVKDVYNLLLLTCKDDYVLEVRAYDDGVAYRWESRRLRPFYVTDERADFNFSADHAAVIPYMDDLRVGDRYSSPFESYYDDTTLSAMIPDSMSITPLAVSLDEGKRAAIFEAGLKDYPGLFLKQNPETRQGLVAELAPYPLEQAVTGRGRNATPTVRADYLARIDQPRRTFPWRVIVISDRDADLLDNDMAYRLAPECRLDDTSWIRPGKVAWDWWNSCNVTGVLFRAGMNTPTYKAFIDFAAENGLEYIIIDEGWSGTESLLTDLNPDIDLAEVIDYGKAKGVGVILWALWRNLTGGTDTCEGMDEVMEHYARMGAAGFKVDFFDRDDQVVVRSAWQVAACAARHHLVLDLHGFRPFGLQRAYPNVLNFEGVRGLEQCKWESYDQGRPVHDFPRNDVIIPYLRTLAGPMDYTPGAMMNANRMEFRTVYLHPMSQGTRVHQMAMYTAYEAPLQMLADSPSRYRLEQDCTDFIASVPTVWDETLALDGALGQYLLMARRSGDAWFIAALTDWTPRTLTLDLSFLPAGSYSAEVFADGVNAASVATDYRRQQDLTLTPADSLSLTLAPGGGWTARLTQQP